MSRVRFAIVPDTAVLALGRVSNLAGVYMFYAMHASRDGSNARPSVNSCASFFGIQKRSVERCLEWLVQHGLMVETGLVENRIMGYRVIRNIALPKDLDLWVELPQEGGNLDESGQLPPESGMQLPHLAQSGCRSEAAQSDSSIRPSTDHLPSGRVDSPLAALPEKPTEPERATPSGPRPEAGERKDLDPNRTRSASLQPKPDLTEQQECEGQAARILDEGMLRDMPVAYRLTAARAAVIAYRRRWPQSWPADWITFADFPQLDGLVKDRAGWIWSHITNYGSGDWTPENRDGSVRLWHASLLAGRIEEAMKLAGVENGYAPEREAAKHREPKKPLIGRGKPRLLRDVTLPELAVPMNGHEPTE